MALTAAEEAAKKEGAKALTKARLMSCLRLMESEHWPVFWELLKANFPMDESVFRFNKAGHFDPLMAAVADGNRAVTIFIHKVSQMAMPSEDDDITSI